MGAFKELMYWFGRGFKPLVFLAVFALPVAILWQKSDNELLHVFLILWSTFVLAGAGYLKYFRGFDKGTIVEPAVVPDQLDLLIERRKGSISLHQNQVSPIHSAEGLEAIQRHCVVEIAIQEKRSDLIPKHAESLADWQHRPGLPDEYRRLGDKLKTVFENTHSALRNSPEGQVILRTEATLTRNKALVEKFLDITQRKVSMLDEYGDENWEALPSEIKTCLKKISEREHFPLDLRKPKGFKGEFTLHHAEQYMPAEYRRMSRRLEQVFRESHRHLKDRPRNQADIANMSGIEFEVHVAERLRRSGYEVQGTPITGDQGADLIAKKDGKKIIIQAKRYQGAVSNKAVQEVISAMTFYGGSEGWVVTNSTFTPSAIALAQKAHVRLVSGSDLKNQSVF